MLNVIIYEDNKNYMEKNINGVNKALMNVDLDYRICKFEKHTKELDNLINDHKIKKIYILDVEMKDVSGIEVASKIREEDSESAIIFATAHDKYHNDVFYNRLMVLDFICKYNGYEKRLIDDMKAAIKVIYKQKVFVFSYNHVLYRIPNDHILYIEKEPIIKRCIIHTLDNDFYIVDSIDRLTKRLGVGFMKTHQSCIVNVNNIKEIDMANSTIIFKNGIKTSLLAEKMKKELKEYVGCC